MDDSPVFRRDSRGQPSLNGGPLSWCCSACGIAAGAPVEVKRRGQTNVGDGYCYACDCPSVFVWTEVGPDHRRIR
jgi:hypothetical protein